MRGQRGFTLIELMVSLAVFSAISVGFYQVLFSSTAGSEAAQDSIHVSEEARLGFNRLVRDTREADTLATPVTSTSFRIFVDFDGSGTIEAVPADPSGSYEQLTISFNRAAETISLAAGTNPPEVLMRGVQCIVVTPDCTVFSYSSSRLEYDSDGNGVTTHPELEAAVGTTNLTVDDPDELSFLDVVSFSMTVRNGDSETTFYADAQLRNRR